MKKDHIDRNYIPSIVIMIIKYVLSQNITVIISGTVIIKVYKDLY